MSDSDSIFASKRRLPCLDGWRALAITLVLGSHFIVSDGFPSALRPVLCRVFDGNLGVRIFFVISGFLITLLILREANVSKFSLKNFWVRRALRILPVYLTFLSVLLVLQKFTPFEMTAQQWLGALTFTANHAGKLEWTTAHLWSLSVEEQFYLVWPLIYCCFANRFAVLGGFAIGAIVTSVVARFLGVASPDVNVLTNISTLTNLDSLAIGCCFAYLAYWRGSLFSDARTQKTLLLFGLCCLIGPRLLFGIGSLKNLVGPLMPLVQAIGFGTLLVLSISSADQRWTKWLQWTPMVWLGTLSYSLYIWQQIFCTSGDVFGLDGAAYLRFPGSILAAVLAAVVSYNFIEKPILSLKNHLRTDRPKVYRPARPVNPLGTLLNGSLKSA